MRSIILAMNNPISSDPAHALFPAPEGCTGHRLWRMLSERRPDLRRADYLRAFDRRNLLPGKVWDRRAAMDHGVDLALDLHNGGYRGTVLVLGEGPREALRLPKLLVHPHRVGEVVFRQLPHPSGRCHWYNHETHRLLAGMLLEELYEMSNG